MAGLDWTVRFALNAGRIEIFKPVPNPAAPSGPQLSSQAAPERGWKQAEDAAVLDASLAGDQGAWSELVARYSRLVYSIPRRHGLDRDACDDVFQEVFAIFVRQLSGIRRRDGLPKWFITTTHRVCRQWFKQARKSMGQEPDTLSRRQLPAESLLEWEQQHHLRLALRRLGGRCEQLLVALYTNQGVATYSEVATKLDMPQGSIGPARARCLRKLSDILSSMEREL